MIACVPLIMPTTLACSSRAEVAPPDERPTRDLGAEDGSGDPHVHTQRIEHVAGRLIDAGRLWEAREAD
jgi:hypothetical protein